MTPTSQNNAHLNHSATTGTVLTTTATRKAAILLAIEVLKEAHDALTGNSDAEADSTTNSAHGVAAWVRSQTFTDGTDESLPAPTSTDTPTPAGTTARRPPTKRPAPPKIPDNSGTRKVRRKVLVDSSDSESDIVFMGMNRNSDMVKAATGSPTVNKKACSQSKGPAPFNPGSNKQPEV
ncbi:hypothetical protein P691DRAFT_781766 [Macrolepiota fuliginosa MF-IS2]|uniref:Uncharacterized protein n=1 Tax=Macrolepiota fuliginosa MF-IS2 TaxID=1400762 RepID=A0A9P6C102_9AGAR|nr:hypothetical protein P691DRAFT_781766 [Macrolepiota fuliginosa MF-IS2]